MALTALNLKNSGVNGVKPEKSGVKTGKIAALTALNRKIRGVNGAQPEK